MIGFAGMADARRMRGAALLVGLLLLVALTGLGAAAGAGTVLQVRMADNFHHRANARGAAAAAARAAEGWLFGLAETTRPVPCAAPCGAGGALLAASTLPDRVESAGGEWWRAHAVVAGTDPVTGDVLVPWRPAGSEPGRWLASEAAVESIETDEGPVEVAYYRVFARGSGPGDRGAAISETVVARPWGVTATNEDANPMTAHRFCRSVPVGLPCGRLASRERR